MDGQSAVDKAVYDALTTNEDIIELVTGVPDDEDVFRVWKGAAPPKLEGKYPYILFSYASGGILNDAPYDAIDMELMVTALALTSTLAREISGYIEETLKNQTLTYDDGWVSNSTVRQTDFFSRSVTVQQSQYWQIGGYYRFRLSKSKD